MIRELSRYTTRFSDLLPPKCQTRPRLLPFPSLLLLLPVSFLSNFLLVDSIGTMQYDTVRCAEGREREVDVFVKAFEMNCFSRSIFAHHITRREKRSIPSSIQSQNPSQIKSYIKKMGNVISKREQTNHS